MRRAGPPGAAAGRGACREVYPPRDRRRPPFYLGSLGPRGERGAMASRSLRSPTGKRNGGSSCHGPCCPPCGTRGPAGPASPGAPQLAQHTVPDTPCPTHRAQHTSPARLWPCLGPLAVCPSCPCCPCCAGPAHARGSLPCGAADPSLSTPSPAPCPVHAALGTACLALAPLLGWGNMGLPAPRPLCARCTPQNNPTQGPCLPRRWVPPRIPGTRSSTAMPLDLPSPHIEGMAAAGRCRAGCQPLSPRARRRGDSGSRGPGLGAAKDQHCRLHVRLCAHVSSSPN